MAKAVIFLRFFSVFAAAVRARKLERNGQHRDAAVSGGTDPHAEKAEQILIDKGFIEERVRLHGNLARIEVKKEDIKKLAEEDMREYIYKSFKEIGFDFVTLDLSGYKTGSMNRNIKS